MCDLAKNQPENVLPVSQNDDAEVSDSSDHDTDTNSESNLNNASPDTCYTDANAEVHRAFKCDDRSVLWWRFIVKVIMIVIAIVLTALTYVQLSKSERNEFEASVSNCVLQHIAAM